jgi:hypothetical protein
MGPTGSPGRSQACYAVSSRWLVALSCFVPHHCGLNCPPGSGAPARTRLAPGQRPRRAKSRPWRTARAAICANCAARRRGRIPWRQLRLPTILTRRTAGKYTLKSVSYLASS